MARINQDCRGFYRINGLDNLFIKIGTNIEIIHTTTLENVTWVFVAINSIRVWVDDKFIDRPSIK